MTTLFDRDVTVAVLASGSGGNCTYIGDGSVGVLIDCGLSTKLIMKRLDDAGLSAAPIDAVLITHEHTDHVGAAKVLCERLRQRANGKYVPFYMTEGTLEGCPDACLPEAVEVFEAGKPFRLRHVEVDPFSIPHDVNDPVAFRLAIGDVAVAVATDLGRSTALVEGKLQALDALVLEFNHDVDTLLNNPNYPWSLKQRIRSNHGHLSNQQAGELLSKVTSERLRHVVLAHLSEKNNSPALALSEARRTLLAQRAEHIAVAVAHQDQVTEPLRLRTAAW